MVIRGLGITVWSWGTIFRVFAQKNGTLANECSANAIYEEISLIYEQISLIYMSVPLRLWDRVNSNGKQVLMTKAQQNWEDRMFILVFGCQLFCAFICHNFVANCHWRKRVKSDRTISPSWKWENHSNVISAHLPLDILEVWGIMWRAFITK